MVEKFIILLFFGLLGGVAVPAWAQNPFKSRAEARQPHPEAVIKSVFLIKIAIWQQHLRQKMSELIREATKGGNIGPLLLLMGMDFAYGAVHAAGPGHGKALAVSYVLSHRFSVGRGLLFGSVVALVHGFSGVVGVVGVLSGTAIVAFGIVFLLAAVNAGCG